MSTAVGFSKWNIFASGLKWKFSFKLIHYGTKQPR
jgi:hypothetical protein